MRQRGLLFPLELQKQPVTQALGELDMMRSAVIAAWEDGVSADYGRGVIGSERALQASLYYHLRPKLDDCDVYIEPKLQYHGHTPSRIPDLVIAARQEIVAIFELKFFPWWCPKKKDIVGDIERLVKLKNLTEKTPLNLSIDPKTGDFSKAYTIAPQAEYFFGLVAADARSAFAQYAPWSLATEDLRPCLHVLYGDVQAGEGVTFQYAGPDSDEINSDIR